MHDFHKNLKRIKDSVRQIFRIAGLLPVYDRLRMYIHIILNWNKNREFIKNNPDIVLPIYELSFDAYGHVNWEIYYNTGKLHALLMNEIIERTIPDLKKLRIMEWGCGSARVLRHLSKDCSYKYTLIGTDYNPKTITWCKETFPEIEFIKNDLAPPLGTDNNCFDCIYAISVFTHLSEEMHFLWIKELFKKLVSGGILIITLHGNKFFRLLSDDEKAVYEKGSLVVRGHVEEGKKYFNAFHPNSFVEKLLSGFTILEHLTDLSAFQFEQDVWVARKPSC